MADEGRRDILKAIAVGAALAVVGGVAGYLGGRKTETITKTVPKEIVETITKTLTKTETVTITPGVTPSPTPTTTPAKPVLKTVVAGPCRFCGTGCGVEAQILVDPTTGKTKDIVAILGKKDFPVNRGSLCIKGFYIHRSIGRGNNTTAMEQRLKKPLVLKDWIIPGKNRPPITPDEIAETPRVRNKQVSKNVLAKTTTVDHIKNNYVEVDWDTAIKFFTAVIEYALKKYGPHAFAYYGSGQLGTEESYAINKLTKAGIQTNNLDGNPRMCMVSAVGGYITSYGADEPELSYDYIDVPEPDTGTHAETFFLIGTNTAEAHPIVFGRIAGVKQKYPDRVKVILADPRKTESGKIADLWLPIRWSMDVALLHTMAYILAYDLDKCRVVDLEEGKVECNFEYIDLKWIKRHVDFAIPQDTIKTWSFTDYNTPAQDMGELNRVWDIGSTASLAGKYKLFPAVGRQYGSEEDVERDWWRGFALYLKFLELYKPEVMTKLVFGDEKPLISRQLAEELIARGELPRDKVDLTGTDPYVEIDAVEALRLAVKWMAKSKTIAVWTMGVNQKVQGVHAVNALINLLALTGNIGKWGAGSLSLTGQPNACGGIRDQGGLAHVLPYGRLIAKEKARKQVEDIWKNLTREYLLERGYTAGEAEAEVAKVKIHPKPGPHVTEMFRRISAGALKVVWIVETNPGQSLPNLFKFRAGMAKPNKDDPAFPFIAVSDIYPTRTTDLADLVLPAAAWGEKEFKYGGTERRYVHATYLLEPPGECVGDAIIFTMVGKALEDKGLIPRGVVSGFFPEDVDKAAKTAGKSWVQYVVEKSRDPRWHAEFINRVWDRDILSLAKNTYYDFTYVKREALRKLGNGFRWPWPSQYATNSDVKSRYDKYHSAGRYVYPYDAIMPKPDTVRKIYSDVEAMGNDTAKIKAYIDGLDENEVHKVHKVKWLGSLANNPPLMRWVLKNLVEEVDDSSYKRGEKLPDSWYVVFYAKPTGRMTVWARPWLPVKYDEAAKEFKIVKQVQVDYRSFNLDRLWKGSIAVFADERGPFDIKAKYSATPLGDPENALQALQDRSWGEVVADRASRRDLEALFAVALAPAEVPGFAIKYKLETGEIITVRDATGYELVSTQGRALEHWHTGTMTGRVPEIVRVKPEAYVEVSAKLAEKLGIRDGDWVVVESPRGKAVFRARVLDPKKRLGGPRVDYVFIPWFDENKLINAVTIDTFDVQPYFFQPDFKTAAATIRPARPDEIPRAKTEQTAAPKYSLPI